MIESERTMFLHSFPPMGVYETLFRFADATQQYLGDAHHPELLIYKVIPEDVLYMREWALEYHVVPTELDS